MSFKQKNLVFLLFFAAGKLAAQQELMLQTLPDLWHSTAVNPAFFPKDKKFVLGLPSYALDGAHSGDITYKDLFVKKDGKTTLDLGNVISRLDPENEVFFDQRIETLSLGLRLGNWSVQGGHANRLNGVVIYPKSLAEVLWNGNAPYIGQTVDVGLRANISDWNEWSVGIARHFKKITVGLRFKYLTGVSALMTDEAHHKASVYTNPDIYQLQLETDYSFNASSLITAIDTSGLGFDLSLGSLKGKAFSKNTGKAFDFGVDWQVTKRLSLNLSVLDWGGKIKWTEEANNFHSNGNYTYNGVTFPGTDIINGSDSLSFDQKLDTLNDIFQFKKTPGSFTSETPQRLYAGGTFQLAKKWQLGLSIFAQNTNNKRRSGVGVSARWQPIRWVSLGAIYSVNNRSAANLGMHVAFTPGPVQVYFLTDNLLGAFTLKSSPAVNFRAGAALAF